MNNPGIGVNALFNNKQNRHTARRSELNSEDRKVTDYYHCTGLYRGATQNYFNLKYGIPDHGSIVFHNLSGYYTHQFIKELGKKCNRDDIGDIAENKEKCIRFDVKINIKQVGLTSKAGKKECKNSQLRFIDCCRFMVSSLDKLESNLCDKMVIWTWVYKGNMELVNSSIKDIALLECKRSKTKKRC